MSSVILIVGPARRTKRGRGTFPLPHKFNLSPYADGPSESAAPQGPRGVLWPSRPACSQGACLCRTSRRRGLSACPGSARWGPRDPGHGHRPRDGGPPSECLCARTALAPPCSRVRFPDKAVSSATAIATPGRQRRDVTCPTHGPGASFGRCPSGRPLGPGPAARTAASGLPSSGPVFRPSVFTTVVFGEYRPVILPLSLNLAFCFFMIFT